MRRNQALPPTEMCTRDRNCGTDITFLPMNAIQASETLRHSQGYNNVLTNGHAFATGKRDDALRGHWQAGAWP
jgi:hypothetical protein